MKEKFCSQSCDNHERCRCRNKERTFEIFETVHVKRNNESYTGYIINYDDINNEYEVARLKIKAESVWVPADCIFKVSESYDEGC